MKYTRKFYCFSPPIMIATFLIEAILAVYTLWRYKLGKVSRLVAAILGFLALFQLAEYMVCEGGFSLSGEVWARIGFVSITMLPLLGLHLASVLAEKKTRWLVPAVYVSGFAFVFFFAFVGQAVTNQVCQGNYVIFGIAPASLWLYMLYYYGWLLAAVWLCGRWAARAKNQANKTALQALAIGYLTFLLPTTTVNMLDPTTTAGIPSIMCGFAVLLAIALVGWVLPAAQEIKHLK